MSLLAAAVDAVEVGDAIEGRLRMESEILSRKMGVVE
jgi:hypothetical protein